MSTSAPRRAEPADRDRLADAALELRGRGLSYAQVGRRLGIGAGSVEYLTSPDYRLRRERAAIGLDEAAVARAVATRDRAMALRADGLTCRQIAEAMAPELGRRVAVGTVDGWLNRGAMPGLAGRGARGDPAPPTRAEIAAALAGLRPDTPEPPPPWHGPPGRVDCPFGRFLARHSPAYARLCRVLDRAEKGGT